MPGTLVSLVAHHCGHVSLQPCAAAISPCTFVGRTVGLAARHRADAPPQPCTAGHRTLRFPPPMTATRRTLPPPGASAGRCSVQSRPLLPKGTRKPLAHRCGDIAAHLRRPDCGLAIRHGSHISPTIAQPFPATDRDPPGTFAGHLCPARPVDTPPSVSPGISAGHFRRPALPPDGVPSSRARPYLKARANPSLTAAAICRVHALRRYRRAPSSAGLSALPPPLRRRVIAAIYRRPSHSLSLPLTAIRRTLLLGTFARRALWALRQAFRPALRWALPPDGVPSSRARPYLKARANPSLTAAAMRPAPSSAGLSALLPVAAARASSRCRFASATRFSSARTKRR